MPTANEQPPRPTGILTLHEFGTTMRELRKWAGLRLKDLNRLDPALRRSTISGYELGQSLPRLERLHTYVMRCLRHRLPHATTSQLEAEFAPWRMEWVRLEQLRIRPATGRTREVNVREVAPTPGVTGNVAVLSPAVTAVPVTATAAPLPADGHHDTRTRRLFPWAWLVAGALAIVIASSTDRPDGGSNDPAQVNGIVENQPVIGVGIDLDSGRAADRSAPGVDINFSDNGAQLNVTSKRVAVTLLPQPQPPDRSYCYYATGWTRQISNIYDLTEGRNICVETNEDHFSMLTVTKRATAGSGTISFKYTTWR